MPDPENLREIRLHFEGPGTRGHTLPAQVLVKSLEQVQRVIYLLAKFKQGDELGQRTRVSYEFEKRFALVCKVPEEGGYVLPAEIGDPSHQLFDAAMIDEVSSTFHCVTTAVNDGNVVMLRNLVPDAAYRTSLIKAYKATQPPKRSGLVLSIEDSEHKKLMDGTTAARALAEFDARPAGVDGGYTPAYITGTLVRMDFEERRLQLKLLNGRGVNATYSDDYEPVLLEHPRDLIQVHGNVRYDEDGVPIALTAVDEILDVDDSPIEIRELTFANRRYRADPPLVFVVEFDRDDLLYDLHGAFDTFLSEETRAALEDALDAALEMLWIEFAEEDPENLSPKAQQLAVELRQRFQEMRDDA